MALQPFFGAQLGDWFVARTGYTGEDGFEIMLPAGEAGQFWQRLNAAGVRSCGLGARDTLRLEAGMNLYGNDMDEHTNPLESGLAWTVAFDPPQRDFIGRAALEAIRARGSEHKLVGLVLDERAVLRSHQRVSCPASARARSPAARSRRHCRARSAWRACRRATGSSVQVEVRGRLLPARVVRPPFVRHGRPMIPLPA